MWGNISIAFLLALIATFMVTPYSNKIAKKNWSSRYTKR